MTNLSTATDWATLDACMAAQDARDLELRKQRYTGVQYDQVTHDYAGFLNGHVVTWARTYTECERRLGEQMNGNSWAARLRTPGERWEGE